MPLLFSSLPCLVASLKQQAKQKCCPYLVHLAMITVQVTREQPREEMTILLWAWRMENSNKEPPSLYHVPRHSGLFFCHTLYYPLSVQEALHVIHWMFGSEEHFWERMTWSEGRACICTLHCIFWLNLCPGNLNCSFPFLYWEASFWYCAMLWFDLCPGN